MNNFFQLSVNLEILQKLAEKIAKQALQGDIFLLEGELGSGKTTFSRFFIESVFEKNLLRKPNSIKSPSFPILINYALKNFEIYHYDFFRLKNISDFIELGIFENFSNNITLIEWPRILLQNNKLQNYYLIKFRIENINFRQLEISHTNKNLYFNTNEY